MTQIDHIQIPMPPGGAEAARPFYAGLLGLREIPPAEGDRPGTLRYAVGHHRLVVAEGRYAGPAPQAHVALLHDDLRHLRHRLRRSGWLQRDAPLPGRDRLFVEDPFGNQFELIEPAAQEHDDGRSAYAPV
jgi:catechol 2,3-dioxygenase-like lactoylglutathione lyase family enzyme